MPSLVTFRPVLPISAVSRGFISVKPLSQFGLYVNANAAASTVSNVVSTAISAFKGFKEAMVYTSMLALLKVLK
jgi:hypothetical protein